MTPENIEFGMHYGMLEEAFGEIMASDLLIESISEMTRDLLDHGQPLSLEDTWESIIGLGVVNILERHELPEEEKAVRFVNDLAFPLIEKLIRLAARAGVVHLKPNYKWDMDRDFVRSYSERVVDLGPTEEDVRPIVFRALRERLNEVLEEKSPGEKKHADMLAVFMLQMWKVEGMLEKVEKGLLLEDHEVVGGMTHRLIVTAGPLTGPVFPIPAAGCNVSVEGPTKAPAMYRVEFRGEQAVLLHFKDGECRGTSKLGETDVFKCGDSTFMYRSHYGSVDRPATFDHTPRTFEFIKPKPFVPPPTVNVGPRAEAFLKLNESALDLVMSHWKQSKYGAILFAERNADGTMHGTYSPQLFPLDESLIASALDPEKRTVVANTATDYCAALYEDGVVFGILYLKIDGAPFLPADLKVFAGYGRFISSALELAIRSEGNPR